MKKVVIIGAGPAGLTAAYQLLTTSDIKVTIYEETDEIGGISKTVEYIISRTISIMYVVFTRLRSPLNNVLKSCLLYCFENASRSSVSTANPFPLTSSCSSDKFISSWKSLSEKIGFKYVGEHIEHYIRIDKDINGNLLFTTKGDNNKSEDKNVRYPQGKVIVNAVSDNL